MSLSVKNMLGGSGQQKFPYVWEKYRRIEISAPITFSFSFPTNNPTATITNNNFDLSLINADNYIDFFTGAICQTQSTYNLTTINGTLYMGSGGLTYNGDGTVTWSTYFYSDNILNFTKDESFLVKNEYICDVTSNNVDEYPSDGMKDGFYYKRKMKPPYAWGKYTYEIAEKRDSAKNINITRTRTSGGSMNVYYSDSYTYDSDTGIFSLVNPTTVTAYCGSSGWNGLGGKYVIQTLDALNGGTTTSGKVLLLIDANATYTEVSAGVYSETNQQAMYGLNVSACTMVYYGANIDFIEYVTDKNPLKYPNGEVADDGFFYRYANEGLYLWDKSISVPKYARNDGATYHDNGSESDKTKDSYIGNFSTKPTLYIASSFDFDDETGIYTLQNPTTQSYSSSSGDYFSLYNRYAMFGSPSGTQMWTNTGSSSYNWVYIDGNDYWLLNRYSQSVTYKITSKIDGIKAIPFDIVVSDSENAYPDGGEQDGYYYKKASGITPKMFGCTKMAIDTLVPTSNIAVTSSNYTVNHSLGEIPKVVLIVANQLPSLNTGFSFIYTRSDFANKWYGTYLCGNNYSAVSNLILQRDVTESTFRIWMQNTRYFVQGVEYSIITMA